MRTAAILRCGASEGKGKLCRTELGKVVVHETGWAAIVAADDIDTAFPEGFASPCHGDRFYDAGAMKFNAQWGPGASDPAPRTYYCDGQRIITIDDVDITQDEIDEYQRQEWDWS